MPNMTMLSLHVKKNSQDPDSIKGKQAFLLSSVEVLYDKELKNKV